MLCYRGRTRRRSHSGVVAPLIQAVPKGLSISLQLEMTLILALMNPEFAVQISDRRCTTPSGPVTDESNKASLLVIRMHDF